MNNDLDQVQAAVEAAVIEVREAYIHVMRGIDEMICLTPIHIRSEQYAEIRRQLQNFRANGHHSEFITYCVIEKVIDHFGRAYGLNTHQRILLSPDFYDLSSN
jgi:hypothetical protein